MLTQSTFWGLEHEDSLLVKNENFIQNTPEQTYELCQQAQQWYQSVMQIAQKENMTVPEYFIEEITGVPEDIRRIIELDVHRTLRSEEYKAPLRVLLTKCWKDFGDYAQPMCLVAGFLRLVLDENKVYQMLYVFNKCNYYIPGYWKAQADGFASDSYTAMNIARMESPEAATILWLKMKFPETFCQKFFTAIGIHVFPFKYQFEIMKKFCAGGRKFLIQLLCAVIDLQKHKINPNLPAQDFYALMRLDPSICETDIFEKIVQKVDSYVMVHNYDVVALREQMYNTYLKERMESARKAQEQNDDDSDEIILSSSSDDE